MIILRPVKQRSRRALTMAEIVVSTAIVGVMTVASLESVGMVYRTRNVNLDRLTGPGLAQELLAEVLAMPYEDPQIVGGGIGLDAGESSGTRTTYDDVDDYDAWDSSVVRKDGTAPDGYAGWQQQVEVVYATLADPSGTVGTDQGLKRITVTVINPDGVESTLTALRARKGSLEQPQGLTASAVTWVGAALQLGDSDRAARSGTAPTNPASDAN